MNKILSIRPFRLLIVSSLILFVSCQGKKTNTLIIATAANAQYAIEEIARNFEENTGTTTEVIISSSGKHTAQIEAGAPYDVFVSADMKFPNHLFELDLTLSEPKIYAHGTLVIWTLNDSMSSSIEELSELNIDNIAMPNPKTAPYGRAAKEALEFYKLYDSLKPKLVFGESVAQTNQFILSNSAQIGFTASSIVNAPKMKDKGKWQTINSEAYSPIAQGVVVIKQSSNLAMATKFFEFLLSSASQEILHNHGYETINTKP